MSFPPHLCSVVIVSSCLLRYPVLVPSSSHPPPAPLPFPPAPLVVLIIAPCLMCFIPAPCVRSRLPCVLVLFLIASLPVFAISRAGRSLLARFLFVAALALSHLVSLAFACLPPLIVFDRSPRPVLISCRRSSRPSFRSCFISLVRLVSPSCDKRWRGAWRLVAACLPPRSRRAGGGRCRLDSVGGAGLLLGVSASGGGCVRFVLSVFVYIDWVLARV